MKIEYWIFDFHKKRTVSNRSFYIKGDHPIKSI